MSSGKNSTITSYISKVALVTLLIVFIVRLFFIESYTISSSQMEASLIKGDKVFVDKTTYGIRMPMTVLSVPFTFDYYSSGITLPYLRIFESKVKRGDILLYNNPVEQDKPLDKRSLLVSRCVALAGDTVRVQNGAMSINGAKYDYSPDLIQTYRVGYEGDSVSVDAEAVKSVLVEYKTPLREFSVEKTSVYAQLSRYEAYMFNQNAPDSLKASIYQTGKENYTIAVPAKGMEVILDESTLLLYGQNILEELGEDAQIIQNTLYMNAKKQTHYTFRDDYLWLLSDNATNAIDSRSIGFIPYTHVIGRVNYIWSGSSARIRQFDRQISRAQ